MIFITGDTHRELDIHTINPREFVEGRTLTRDDYVIICGDFGCIWDGGSGDRFWLNWLESEGWNTLFIDGNHENFDVLNQYPEETWHGGKVHRIRSNIFHLMRGEVFDIEGKSFFTFGGASSMMLNIVQNIKLGGKMNYQQLLKLNMHIKHLRSTIGKWIMY